MITNKELSSYLNEYLSCTRFVDYAPNGLQVQGKLNIKRVCTAVTASEDAIDQAIAWKADALLVHHGYFWRGEDPTIVGMKKQRLAKLLAHDINLYAYHLPLDCHPELGNNACLAQLLDIQSIQKHKVGNTDNLLWSGALAKPLNASDFSNQLAQKLGQTPITICVSDKPISTLAWCSGGAQDYIEDAYRLGVDAYLSGEISERTYYQAKELGIHYFACGHHATERYGIQALGALLSKYFHLEHEFVDSHNPI